MTIESVVAALKEHPRGAKLLVTGYPNVNLAETEGYQIKEEISTALKTAGLKEILAYLLPQRCQWFQDGRT